MQQQQNTTAQPSTDTQPVLVCSQRWQSGSHRWVAVQASSAAASADLTMGPRHFPPQLQDHTQSFYMHRHSTHYSLTIDNSYHNHSSVTWLWPTITHHLRTIQTIVENVYVWLAGPRHPCVWTLRVLARNLLTYLLTVAEFHALFTTNSLIGNIKNYTIITILYQFLSRHNVVTSENATAANYTEHLSNPVAWPENWTRTMYARNSTKSRHAGSRTQATSLTRSVQHASC